MIGSKWNVFKEGFETYLNSQKGHGTIPLSYVIRVLDGVNSLDLAGPAWPWTQEHDKKKDGCKACKSLIAHYEGDSVINRNKKAAYASITCSEYLGDRCAFTFETYVTLHQQAHLDLERYGEVVPESKKVRDLLAGIKDGNSLAAKLAVQDSPLFLNDFTQATNFLATALDTETKRSVRNLSQVESKDETQRGYQGRGTQGGYQGRGRGSHI